MSEPLFLTDRAAPYPLGYARERMLEAVRVFPACADDAVRDALVSYTGHVARDCARRADELGLLMQAEVFAALAGALEREPRDRPISTERAGIYHALLDSAYTDEAVRRVEPLLALLERTP
jgi:hypothetical protein